MTRLLLPLLLAVAICGCSIVSALHPDASRYYVLTPIALTDGTGTAVAPARGIVIGLGPITIPRYLDRSELVARIKPNELKPADHDRWADPLATQIRAILAQNLGMLLGTDRIVPFPWFAGTTLDYVITVDIYAFEHGTGSQADMVARWVVKRAADGTVVRADDARLQRSASSAASADVVAALSQALGDLSRSIADAIP